MESEMEIKHYKYSFILSFSLSLVLSLSYSFFPLFSYLQQQTLAIVFILYAQLIVQKPHLRGIQMLDKLERTLFDLRLSKH